MKDSYKEFINAFNIDYDDYLEWGINNTIYPDYNRVSQFWDELKRRITNHELVYVRGYGRGGKGNDIVTDFYAYYEYKTKTDPNNNSIPTKNLQLLTGEIKATERKNNAALFNYQVSHIFGNTKNIFMFEAPWNVCFVPKLFDPLTGHEALGQFPDDYQDRWLKIIKLKYKAFIDDYNEIIRDFDIQKKVDDFLNDPAIDAKYPKERKERFRKDIIKEFAPI